MLVYIAWGFAQSFRTGFRAWRSGLPVYATALHVGRRVTVVYGTKPGPGSAESSAFAAMTTGLLFPGMLLAVAAYVGTNSVHMGIELVRALAR